jgi:hypothetical protein
MRSNVYPSNVTMEADDIRLVRLLPGAWADPIRCELFYDSLSTVGPYYALSYVWGSQNNGRHIQLNAQPFYVTINLESALRHLRRQLNNTLLWIDALSINQTDDRERIHQVKLMGKIYQSCQSVLVYLGDSTPRCRHKAELAPLRDGPPVITLFDNKHGFCSSERFASDAPSQVDAQRRDDTGSQRIQNIMQVFQFIQDICLADHLVNIPAFASRPEGDLEREDRKSFVRKLTATHVWPCHSVVGQDLGCTGSHIAARGHRGTRHDIRSMVDVLESRYPMFLSPPPLLRERCRETPSRHPRRAH